MKLNEVGIQRAKFKFLLVPLTSYVTLNRLSPLPTYELQPHNLSERSMAQELLGTRRERRTRPLKPSNPLLHYLKYQQPTGRADVSSLGGKQTCNSTSSCFNKIKGLDSGQSRLPEFKSCSLTRLESLRNCHDFFTFQFPPV